MASHYKRVINAKCTRLLSLSLVLILELALFIHHVFGNQNNIASIDASPPKSLVQSQKARDRARREFLRTSFQGGSGAGGGNSSARAQSVDTAVCFHLALVFLLSVRYST